MDREALKQILPHREPMLLVDESVMDGEVVHSKYHVRGDEFFLQGHFPGYPCIVSANDRYCPLFSVI